MGRDESHVNELTDQIKMNAIGLVKDVNAMLDEAGWQGPRLVSSGWRPKTINHAKGGAPNSGHIYGLAIDLSDNSRQALAYFILDRPHLLKKYDLFIENPATTKNWVHLDKKLRIDRPSRMFTIKVEK